jgi:hypothetical protein
MPEQLLEQLKPVITFFGDTPWMKGGMIIVFRYSSHGLCSGLSRAAFVA